MPATASALIDTLRAEADYNAASDAAMLDLLNRTQLRLQREFDFNFLERYTSQTLATATGSGYLTFATPTDTKALISLFYVENNVRTPIVYKDFFEALSVYPDATKTGKPEMYSEFQKTIFIFPTSNSALSLERYDQKLVADLTLTASNDFLVYAHDALFYGTMKSFALYRGEDQKAQGWGQLEAEAVQSALKVQTRARERRRSSTIPNTPGKIG